MYEYRATIVKVADGDTIDVLIDLGFSMQSKQRIRLARINTPEIRGKERPEGLKSKEFVQQYEGKEIILKTYKDKKGKYGRYIGDIMIDDGCLNDILVESGLAEYVNY